MRQAVLITAYHDFVQLQRLVDYFDDDFELFIHIDRRCRQLPASLKEKANVHVYRRYRVYWGSVNHLRAILLLMSEAAKHADLEYFHLVTGNDFPVPALSEFKAFCEMHCHENHLEYFPLPRTSWDGEGGMERIRYHWLQPWLQPSKQETLGYRLTVNFIKLQRKLGLHRKFGYFEGRVFGGGTYWSVSRQAIVFVIEYLEAHPDYLRRFRMTKIAEEICLPTLWANSGLPLTNNSLRYFDWSENGGSPKILDESDYEAVVASDALFARKIQTGVSDSLINKLCCRVD